MIFYVITFEFSFRIINRFASYQGYSLYILAIRSCLTLLKFYLAIVGLDAQVKWNLRLWSINVTQLYRLRINKCGNPVPTQQISIGIN